MKKIVSILYCISFCFLSPMQAQTPFDSFAPETSRQILDERAIAAEQEAERVKRESQMDTIVCAAVIDLENQVLLLVDVCDNIIIGAAPLTEEVKKWLSVDPLVDKNISTSPYMYCNGNPIIFVDPDGMDIWEMDEYGFVVNHIKDKTQDAFRMNGRQISYKYGSVTGYSQKNGKTSFTFNNEDIAADAFKFMADNSSVEYGLITTSSGFSRIVTKHIEDKVGIGMSDLQINEDARIETFIHNHHNTGDPSGFKEGKKDGDKSALSSMEKEIGYDVAAFIYHSNILRMYSANEDNLGISSWNVYYPNIGVISSKTPSLIYRIKHIIGIH